MAKVSLNCCRAVKPEGVPVEASALGVILNLSGTVCLAPVPSILECLHERGSGASPVPAGRKQERRIYHCQSRSLR